MQFYKNLGRNTLILLALGVILFAFFPSHVAEAIELYGTIIGSAALVLLIGAAIPRQES